MNNKVILIAVVALLLVGGWYFFMQKPSTSVPEGTTQQVTQPVSQETGVVASKNVVNIKSFAFSPVALTVKVGDTVTWTNNDSTGHSATAEDGSFDTGVLSQGESGTATFTKAGTFAYYCSVHPSMKATIVVQP